MTASFLFTPPPKYYLPLALGGDLVVDFQNNPSGDLKTFVDYDAGVSVTLAIDTTTPITAPATVSGSDASVHIDSTVTDLIPAGTGWRLVVATSSPVTGIVAAYRTVKRFDG
jgi:hypothetical protein